MTIIKCTENIDISAMSVNFSNVATLPQNSRKRRGCFLLLRIGDSLLLPMVGLSMMCVFILSIKNNDFKAACDA